MTITMNVQHAKANLSRLLVAVENGEDVVLARRGVPVARVVPVGEESRVQLGFWPGLCTDEAATPVLTDIADRWYS